MHSCIKEVFLYRLCSYINNNNNNQQGYFKDMFCLLRKYNLVDIVQSYMNSDEFPSKNGMETISKPMHKNASGILMECE